jgi:hypothetical protein
MKIIKVFILALIVIVIAIQFIPDGLPENKADDNQSIKKDTLVPQSVLTILETSCFDCHSNQTDFPWYASIAPTSWMLANHIKEGRDNLNFSEWLSYSKRKKIGMLEDIQEQVSGGGMPLKSYILIHHKAKLTAEEISVINKWTEDATSKIMH